MMCCIYAGVWVISLALFYIIPQAAEQDKAEGVADDEAVCCSFAYITRDAS